MENFSTNNTEFLEIIDELIKNETVQEMKKYRQHYETSCYEHCYMAAFYCYLICKKLGLDYKSATRAAMLHDLFLYDWRKKQPDRKGLHAYTHAKTACENACKIFDLSKKEQSIIKTHMWPLTIGIPKSPEALILTFVDKYCALSESFDVMKTRAFMKKYFRYAYAFLCLMIIKL